MPRGKSCARRSRAARADAAPSSATRIASTRSSVSCSPTPAPATGRWPSSRSAATDAATSVCTSISICCCCSAAASVPPRSGSSTAFSTRSGISAIIALGGYGRRHLCLHSDIDLLLLFGSGIGPAEERFVNSFLNPLWDLGVVVGHQVRDIDEFQRLETDNPEFLLALLDARPVAGARSVFERFGAVFHQPATHAFILRSLLELIDDRHAQFNSTLYQLEPDVKDAPGALRDLTATRTIALLTDPLLLRRGPADAARFEGVRSENGTLRRANALPSRAMGFSASGVKFRGSLVAGEGSAFALRRV